mmetsp:Transcript_37037/g.93134  ORF Transcript_37037/g.93134 Transcript_37037/m.93134 type:complete len:280 (-) Transcript_37037:888-1727(-)
MKRMRMMGLGPSPSLPVSIPMQPRGRQATALAMAPMAGLQGSRPMSRMSRLQRRRRATVDSGPSMSPQPRQKETLALAPLPSLLVGHLMQPRWRHRAAVSWAPLKGLTCRVLTPLRRPRIRQVRTLLLKAREQPTLAHLKTPRRCLLRRVEMLRRKTWLVVPWAGLVGRSSAQRLKQRRAKLTLVTPMGRQQRLLREQGMVQARTAVLAHLLRLPAIRLQGQAWQMRPRRHLVQRLQLHRAAASGTLTARWQSPRVQQRKQQRRTVGLAHLTALQKCHL